MRAQERLLLSAERSLIFGTNRSKLFIKMSSNKNSFDLGARLRACRVDSGLSQRALAKRVGIPSSSISLVENGRVSPSVGSLKRILDSLQISLGDFFNPLGAEQPPAFFHRADDMLEIGKGGISYRQVGKRLEPTSLQILYETYQPGADTGRISLSHEGQEGAIIISGQLEVTVDGERATLGVGDAYLFDSRLPHRFRNLHSSECRLISACTPPTF